MALPLASLTAVGCLATDLYLPAVPSLPALFGGSIAQSQYTLASFMATLAFSQILWGWLSDQYGEKLILKCGMALLFLASVACALADNIDFLIVGRAFQGLGAGAATAVVPALLKKTFQGADAVRSIAVVGMAESFAPALGPILGAILISFFDWRSAFWAISLMTLILIPFVSKVVRGASHPALNKNNLLKNLKEIAGSKNFLKSSLSYSFMYSALMMFVTSAPQIIASSFNISMRYFSLLQVLAVIAFIATASQGGRMVEKYGTERVLFFGSCLQILSGLIFLSLALFLPSYFVTLSMGWCCFGAGLGFRAPTLFARSLDNAGSHAGQASGLLMSLSLGISALSTASIAPLLHFGLLPVALGVLLLTVLSVMLSQSSQSPLEA